MGFYAGEESIAALWGKVKSALSTSLESVAAKDHKHSAGDVTSGTFAAGRIPSLDASKVGSGTFATDRIPSLATSKITSGSFDVARGGTGRSTLTSGSYLVGNGTSAVNMKTKDQVKEDLGIKNYADIVLLWENASPSSSFNAQTISLNLSEYDYIEIDFKLRSKDSIIVEKVAGYVGQISVGYGCSGGAWWYRRAVVELNSVAFEVATVASGTSSSSDSGTTTMIPYRIYGIKGAKTA